MKADVIFALDIGGTFIKACGIENNTIIYETMSEFHAFSHENTDSVIDRFVSIILSLSESYNKYKQKMNTSDVNYLYKQSIGIGLAFPGPFNYTEGISYIQGLSKYESLYGVNVRNELLKKLKKTEFAQNTGGISILFQNDGRLFGLGASTMYPNERLICLTIGTGLGSVFIDQGEIINKGENVPPGGYLYNQPFSGRANDEHFSRRGLLKLATSEKSYDESVDVKELADFAKQGDLEAQAAFNKFGAKLAVMLAPYLKQFQPHRIVIGGQIAKSFDLFEKGFREELLPDKMNVVPIDDAVSVTFHGINRLFVIRESPSLSG